MHQVLEQFETPDTVPEKPTVVLSRQDIKMIEGLVPTAHDAAGAMLRKEWLNELKSDFQSAEFKENSKLWGKKAVSVIKKIVKPQSRRG
jgi:hypothetical protein